MNRILLYEEFDSQQAPHREALCTLGWLLGQKVRIVPSVIRGIDEEVKTLDVDLTRETIENGTAL
jgi:hypothetical protein